MSQRPGTVIQGYSDRIHHALAFAAKHHDQQVRKGTRPPYFTQPANVGIILSRYGCDDVTVIAGVLHDVVEDTLAEGHGHEMFEQRMREKFGAEVLTTILAVAPRRVNDDGIELDPMERRDDVLQRLGAASESARWVCAATRLHSAASLLADLRRTVDPSSVWSRFSGGRETTIHAYRQLVDRLRELPFQAPIVDELDEVVAALESGSRG